MSQVKPYKRASSQRQKAQRTSLQFLNARRLATFVTMVGLGAFGLWSYFHAPAFLLEVSHRIEMIAASLGFRLEDVVVQGRIRTDKAQILKTLELEKGKPLLAVSLSNAKEKLEAISWVNAVSIERRFPDTLFIRISEKDPVALWQNQGKTFLVDRSGETVEIHEAYKYKNLLIVTGEGAPHHVGHLVTLLERFPDIKFRVTSATHLRSSRWDIKLDGKIDVKLPEKEPEKALAYLFELEKHHSLMEREIVTIDMRLPGQLILRLTPDAAQRKNNTGKDA